MAVLKYKSNGQWYPSNSLPDALSGASNPTSSTEALYVGQHYLNTSTNIEWVCVSINNGVYGWEMVNARLMSNRNLLDNPWFTVNQRGVTTWTRNAYGCDRWIAEYSTGDATISSASDGTITITYINGNGNIWQKLETDLKNELNGKTITGSVLLSDGTILSGSGVFNLGTELDFVNNTRIKLFMSASGNFNSQAKETMSIRAVKLELGSISTLANDTAPNYAEELLKCQRYYQRFNADKLYSMIGDVGYGISTTTFRNVIKLNTRMRTVPTVGYRNLGVSEITSYAILKSDITGIVAHEHLSSKDEVFTICTCSGLVDGHVYIMRANNTNNAYIEFSADL